MSIEGLGKKFQEARRARNLTLDEAARMTKIRPARLAEIEAEDFSQFPSLAYAKGFLLIYGKFLDVDVTPYLDAFEDSERVTIDGYSYLQDNSPPKPVTAPVVRRSRRSDRSNRSSSDRVSPMPLIFGILVLVIGFSAMKLILNLRRIAPRGPEAAQVSPGAKPNPGSTTAPATTTQSQTPSVASATTAAAAPSPSPVAATTARPASAEPEVRRAKPVGPEDIAKARTETSPSPAKSSEQNRVAIRPLKRTYLKVIVDNGSENPPFERWISPSDGTVEFRGKHVAIRVLDPDAIQIKKNGQAIADHDEDVTIN
jgi:cytoskeletal protein RodZ